MKAMIMDMCILSHKTQCFLMFGHVVGVGEGKLRTITIPILYYIYIYVYIYIYISLILYSFYTTSTPLLYYIYQLNTTYIILYNSLHTTGLAPVAPISQMPMLGLEAFFSPSQAWKENPWDFIEITKKKFRIAVLLQQSPAWLRDLKCDMIMMTQTIHRLSSSAINRMGILQLTKPAKPASHMQSRARGKASKQRKIPTKHPSTAASSSSNLSRKNTKSSQLETTVSWRVSH